MLSGCWRARGLPSSPFRRNRSPPAAGLVEMQQAGDWLDPSMPGRYGQHQTAPPRCRGPFHTLRRRIVEGGRRSVRPGTQSRRASLHELEILVTTDATAVSTALCAARPDVMTVVFCTYQSLASSNRHPMKVRRLLTWSSVTKLIGPPASSDQVIRPPRWGRAPAPSARTVPGSIRHSCGAAAACGRAAWCSHPGGDYAGTRRCASFAQGPPAPPVTRGQGGDRATRIRPPGATGRGGGNPTPSIPPVCGRRWFDSPIDQLWLIVASRFWPFASDTPPAGAPRPATGIVEQPSTVRRPLREAGWEAWRAR